MGDMSYINDSEIEPAPVNKFDPRVELKRKVLRTDLKMYLAKIYSSACSHGKKINTLADIETPHKVRHMLLAIGFDNETIGGIFRKNENDKVKTLRMETQSSKEAYETLIECERNWEEAEFCNLMPVISTPDSELTDICMPAFIYISELEKEFGMGFTSTVITELRRLSEANVENVFQCNLIEESEDK